MNNDNFERMMNNLLEKQKFNAEKLNNLEKDLAAAKEDNNSRKIDSCNIKINSLIKTIKISKNKIKSIRPDTKEDLDERNNVLNNFNNIIDESIPDDLPIVFHGNGDINTVEEIINSGGLFTPEERGVEFTSQATLIDVTCKKNTQVSLNFANDNSGPFLPYGAIFVFLPKEDEYEKVFETKTNSEVYGGVESINFSEDRFIGIMTTNENLEFIKTIMINNGLNPNKVFNHQQFIDYCQCQYISETKNK
ncbi:MAG: hypothetical protein R3Y13_05325 [bacterium]